jgi:hypothetical protein
VLLRVWRREAPVKVRRYVAVRNNPAQKPCRLAIATGQQEHDGHAQPLAFSGLRASAAKITLQRNILSSTEKMRYKLLYHINYECDFQQN